MANEITSNTTLSVTKGNLSKSNRANVSINMNGTHYAGGAPTIPTTAAGTALSLGSVATTGIAVFRNLDATNFCEIGVQTGGTTFIPHVRLKPGEAAQYRVSPSQAPFARADTASVVLEYWIFED